MSNDNYRKLCFTGQTGQEEEDGGEPGGADATTDADALFLEVDGKHGLRGLPAIGLKVPCAPK